MHNKMAFQSNATITLSSRTALKWWSLYDEVLVNMVENGWDLGQGTCMVGGGAGSNDQMNKFE